MFEKSIELLNKGVAEEIQAVHQYMYFHFHAEDQGYELLSQLFFRTAIEEMNHVELLAERNLFLGGEVEMVAAGPVEKIHDITAMLELARDMELQAVKDYNVRAMECGQNADSGTKKIFERLVDEEELHMDQFQTELDNLKKFGDRYLALQSIERSKNIAAGTPAE